MLQDSMWQENLKILQNFLELNKAYEKWFPEFYSLFFIGLTLSPFICCFGFSYHNFD